MATKDEYEKGMIGTFERYEVLFNNMDVTKVEFLQWLYSLVSHDELRKASTFINTRMLKMLTVVYAMWCVHGTDTWMNLFLISEDSLDVKKIRGHLKDLRNLWNKRPKPKRRPSNGG